ncbi:MAG: zinc-binding dehydrogenase [Chloroflexota bacterium]|nr:zinc-binding dehydrogenase [Chloroflexota bacterium]
MEALVKYANEPGAVELRDIPEPEIGPDDALLKVCAVGICGSDLEMYHHQVGFEVRPPVVLGHEFSGTVVEVGSNVKGFAPGDRVVSETAAYVCGVCVQCRTGRYNECPNRRGFGVMYNGADAAYVAVRQGILHHVPTNVDLAEAALTEPLCVAYNALVVKSRIRPADLVVILGPGPIGLMATQIARVCGASNIVLAGLSSNAQRLSIGRTLGATHTIDLETDDLRALVAELSGGVGADLVVDAAGPSATVKMAMDIVKRNGQITKIAWGPKPLDLSLDLLLAKAVTFQGVFSHTWDTWERALLLESSGQVRLSDMISHRVSLKDWKVAFDALENGEAVKALIFPNGVSASSRQGPLQGEVK